MPYILAGIYSRPLPASDTDGEKYTSAGHTDFLTLLSMCLPLLTASVSQVDKTELCR